MRKIKKILFYYRGLPNSDMPMEGTSRSLLNWAEYCVLAGIAEKVDVSGDYIKKAQKQANIHYRKIPKTGNEEKFLADYDMVFFFTLRGIFANCQKPKGQVWVLEQQCFNVAQSERGRADVFDFLVAHSNAQKYNMIKQGVKPECVFVLPNICDFDKEDLLQIHKRDENSIMFVGAIVPHKGLDILIDALPKIRQKRPNVSVHVYGSSAMWKTAGNEYEKAIRSKKVKDIFYHGAVSSDVIIKEYQKHSIMCLPTELECFPHVSIEAQNGGCIPVIHDAGGSYATMSVNSTGFVYKPNTPAMVAKTIDKAFLKLTKDKKMREKAKRFALDKFSQEVVGGKIEQFFYHIKNNKKFLSASLFDFENYIKSAVLSEDTLYGVVKKEIKKITIITGMRSNLLKNKNTLNIYEAFSLGRRLYAEGAVKISALWLNEIIKLKNIDKETKLQSYFLLADINKQNTKKAAVFNQKGINVLVVSKNKTNDNVYRIASLYKEKKLYPQSKKWFHKLLKSKLSSNLKGGIYFHLGEIDFIQSDASSALKSFKNCLKYIPNHSKALNYLEKIS